MIDKGALSLPFLIGSDIIKYYFNNEQYRRTYWIDESK
nr:MAG TPA: hypothetical protein [Caudoviricetes sp.]